MTNIQENLGAEPNKEDFVLISDEVVRAKINAQLEYITAREFLTPYVGLEAVRKILAYQNIFIPNTVFMDRTSGYDIFDADQFGEKLGMNNDGEVVTAPSSPFKVYFEWKLNDGGEYDIFCSIVTDDELEELLTDTEEDEDEDEEEEMNEEKKPPFEGPYSKTVAPKTEKKKHNEVAKLARRAIKKVKKKLEEDYPITVKEGTSDVLDKGLKRTDLGLSDKLNKKGKLSKHTQKWMKTLASGSGSLYSRSLGKPKGHLPEEQQLNELHGKSREAIKKIKARLEKKHDDEWEATKEKRKEKKSAGPNDTRDEDKSRNNLAKRWLRADKAEKKLKEDYDHKAKEDHDETKNIASGARRKSDKKRWKSFVDYNNKRAVTGMEGKHEGKKIDEDYEKDAADLSKKYAAYAKHEKAMSKSNSLAAQLSPYYRKEMAKRSRDSKAISKRLAKRALTGMEGNHEGKKLKESKDATKDVSKMLASKGKTLVRNKSGLAVLRKIKKK